MNSDKTSSSYLFLDVLSGIFVAVLLASNIASTKIVTLAGLSFDGGTLLFPLAYIFGDILTEVYGYGRSRRIIWLGFFSLALMTLILTLVGLLPAPPDWPHQQAFQTILGQTPRIVLASLTAYFVGEFANSFTLAKLKVMSRGRFLWVRTIGSTLVGEALDTALFVMIAFYLVLEPQLLWWVAVSNYVFKVGVEVVLTPVTYAVVNKLKHLEQEDYYDRETNFNPFRVSVG